MNYAIIENGIVKNIIALDPDNDHDFPGAVLMDGIPTGIGDSYDGAHFYRNGERLLNAAEIIADMEAALETLGVNVNG